VVQDFHELSSVYFYKVDAADCTNLIQWLFMDGQVEKRRFTGRLNDQIGQRNLFNPTCPIGSGTCCSSGISITPEIGKMLILHGLSSGQDTTFLYK
jgi:hypothetical protein